MSNNSLNSRPLLFRCGILLSFTCNDNIIGACSMEVFGSLLSDFRIAEKYKILSVWRYSGPIKF